MPRLCVPLALLVSLVLPVAGAGAQNTRELDPAIQHVVSGGSWTAGGRTGRYRTIIRTGGFDHVVSSLTLQWIEDRDDAEPEVVRSVLVRDLSGTGRLDAPTLVRRGTTWVLGVEWTDTHGHDGSRRVSLSLGLPGRYALVEDR